MRHPTAGGPSPIHKLADKFSLWPFSVWASSGERHVDFIERYLGFSPDHGDGSLEAMLLIVLVTIITGIALGFFRKAEHDVVKRPKRNY
jgi:hypothetical protein